jgi:hypothetical protein
LLFWDWRGPAAGDSSASTQLLLARSPFHGDNVVQHGPVGHRPAEFETIDPRSHDASAPAGLSTRELRAARSGRMPPDGGARHAAGFSRAGRREHSVRGVTTAPPVLWRSTMSSGDCSRSGNSAPEPTAQLQADSLDAPLPPDGRSCDMRLSAAGHDASDDGAASAGAAQGVAYVAQQLRRTTSAPADLYMPRCALRATELAVGVGARPGTAMPSEKAAQRGDHPSHVIARDLF